MSEYKRLTRYRDNGYAKLKACDTYREVDCKENCVKCGELTLAVRRLAELEDKIEAGTLVELPETKIDIDSVGGDWYIVYHKVVTKTEGNFNTREAAEARLKELEKCR